MNVTLIYWIYSSLKFVDAGAESMDGWIHGWMDPWMDAGAESDLCMKGLFIYLTPLTHSTYCQEGI